ncbi:MAG: 3-phosphoshikimate 1-carboxyvinyltransferase [Candidatus Latescibacterota bacterium]
MKACVEYSEHLSGRIDAPSSKNYTTRYLLVAALAEGESLVHYPAASDDAKAMVSCLRRFGARIEEAEDARGKVLRVQGFGGRPAPPGVVDPGNAGAVLRFLMGVGSLLPEVRFATRFAESLGRRPHGDLLAALGQLGIASESDDGRLPITLRGGPPRGGRLWVSGASSSQYLSSLLFLAPLLPGGLEIEVRHGLVSGPLVRTTLEVMRQAGIQVESAEDLLQFRVPGGQTYQAREYWVNGDYPSSAALLAAGAVTRGHIVVGRLFEDSQGERAVVPLLRRMGVSVAQQASEVGVQGHAGLRAVEFDGDAATDLVLAMVAVAAFAEGESRFYNVGNLRLKECDRLAVPVRELRRLGVDCEEGTSEIRVRGCPAGYDGGLEVPTHSDHRVAQMLTIVGLRCRHGLTVLDAQTVGKSYPGFYDDLTRLGARIRMED